MHTRILDGNATARELREGLIRRVAALAARGVRPGLAVVQVGDHAASKVYLQNKIKACGEAGLHSEHIELPEAAGESALLGRIRILNNDVRVHGILVQLPLPQGYSVDRVIETISPAKDVDGFHPTNMGLLAIGNPRFVPCTPLGVMKLLEREGIVPEGRHAVVVGRSNIVGKPMALLLLQKGATVTICNSRTPDLGAMTRQGDILVAAAGRSKLVTAGMVKPGALARREVDEQLAPFVMLLVLTSPEANPRIETEVSLFDRQSLRLDREGIGPNARTLGMDGTRSA